MIVASGPVIPNFGSGSSCEVNNGWFCTEWVRQHWSDTLQPALFQHIELAAIAVGIGFAIAMALALAGFRYRLLDPPIGFVSDFLYTIPSLALFQILVPFTGISLLTVEIALVSYTLVILYRNMIEGLRAVPAEIIEVARGRFVIAKGLGQPIYDALGQDVFKTEIFMAGGMVIALALVSDTLLVLLQRALTPWARA